MKSKFNKIPDTEIEDDADIEAGGPAIAAAKKSKMAVVAASSILITVVIYFMFFKGEKKVEENLVEIAPPKVTTVARSEEGKSPFELEDLENVKEDDDISLLEKPAVPEVPELPSLPEGSLLPDQNIIAQAPEAQNQQLPNQQQQQQNPNVLPQPKAPPVIPISNDDPYDNDPFANAKQVQQKKAIKQNTTYENNPRYAPIIVFSGIAEGTPSRGVGYENNIVKLNKDPIEDLNTTTTTVTATYIKDRTHTIAQGKLLTAVLETAINTEIPGFVRAVVSRDIYGEAGNDVLVPRGSRLFGSYSSKINKGQGRVEIAWTRLIRPDGVDLAINFNASDQFGRSGLPGDVDNKYGSIVASSMLTSILAVGSVAAAQELLTDDATTTTTTNASQGTTTTTGSATNQAIYDVSKTIIDTVGEVVGNTINIDPVIRVPQGTRITVIVNSDIVVPSMSSN